MDDTPSSEPSAVIVVRLRKDRHELDAREAKRIVNLMRYRGLALHNSYEKKGRKWWLSNGRSVAPTAAALIIKRDDVVGVGDTLLVGELSQTYRYSGPLSPPPEGPQPA